MEELIINESNLFPHTQAIIGSYGVRVTEGKYNVVCKEFSENKHWTKKEEEKRLALEAFKRKGVK